MYETFHKRSHRTVPQNRRMDNRPDPIFSRNRRWWCTPSLESLLRSRFRYFPTACSTSSRNGETRNFLISQRDNARDRDTYACVRVYPRTHTQSRSNDICHCRMDNNVCLSPISGCSSLLILRDSTYRVVLSARTFASTRRHTYAYMHILCARARSPTHSPFTHRRGRATA